MWGFSHRQFLVLKNSTAHQHTQANTTTKHTNMWHQKIRKTKAIANAVFNATGKRLRDLPLTPDKLLKKA